MTEAQKSNCSAVFNYPHIKNRNLNKNVIQIAQKTAEATGIFKICS
jgi:hypothetical protein